jgi:hypothetical protein
MIEKIKKILKTIWNELVYGGHLIALGGVCIIATSAIALNIRLTWQPIVVVYLIIIVGLLYNRYEKQ